MLGNGTPVPQTPIANLTSPVPIEGVPGELQATVQSLIELSTKERLNGPLDPNGLGGLVSVLIVSPALNYHVYMNVSAHIFYRKKHLRM